MTELRADIARTFPVDRERMWALWTEARHLERWMRPSMTAYGETRAEVDARAGGRYRFELEGPDGPLAMSGTFVAFEPHDRLAYTWQWDGSKEETLVEIAFTDGDGGGTLVQLTHSRFTTAESAARHGDGWRGCLDSMSALVAEQVGVPSAD
ncbi:SRPBCC family protein [Agromyces mangrovi Wang et al. 2018]|uniref:SRPBCC family protein n=1 Tax=Agromyces mangrovi TaxID=1858653 RepID=UPI0025738A37|nr:SRPBCC domain-containing protein [Agromyces mangrovi]BDZ64845.1 hypothetical protein GCM10025877_17830 [Agromyces mangrovi]